MPLRHSKNSTSRGRGAPMPTPRGLGEGCISSGLRQFPCVILIFNGKDATHCAIVFFSWKHVPTIRHYAICDRVARFGGAAIAFPFTFTLTFTAFLVALEVVFIANVAFALSLLLSGNRWRLAFVVTFGTLCLILSSMGRVRGTFTRKRHRGVGVNGGICIGV